jgi:hypothetical protein
MHHENIVGSQYEPPGALQKSNLVIEAFLGLMAFI